jgi:hypothetical protein
MAHDVRVVAEAMAMQLRERGEASPFLAEVKFEGDAIRYRLPDWIGEARARFRELYDAPEDDVRGEKALAVFQERLFCQLEGTSDAAVEDLGAILDDLLEQEERPTGTA